MGIKSLLKFLNDFPNIIKKSNINNFKGKKIAIDISILLYQFVINIRNSGSDLTNKQGEITSHILGLFNKTILLLKRNIFPIYVFDGKPPDIKNKTLKSRKNNKLVSYLKMKETKNEEDKIKYFKRCVIITEKQIEQCKELLDLMGIPYIQAPEEADTQCAYLAKEGFVDGVLTNDMDILTFGAPIIYRNLISYKLEPEIIKLDDILKRLKLDHEEFVEFCILLGCDYCTGITKIKPNIVYNYYIIYKNIPDTLKALKNDKYDVKKIKYDTAKDYFLENYNIKRVKEINFLKADTNKLIKVLVNKYNLIKFKIINKIKFLKNYKMI